jgi:capsular polysaccharide biosynthesis protein
MGAIIGGLASVGLAFLAERMDQSLKTSQDVEERLNLPVLVSIPRLPRRLADLNGATRK